MNLILLIVNIIIIASRRNQNPWVSALILTGVNALGGLVLYFSYINHLPTFVFFLVLLAIVVSYFYDLICFFIANSIETESSFLYVIVFTVAQIVMGLLVGAFVYAIVDLDDLEDRFLDSFDTETPTERRTIRNGDESEEERYIPKEYNIEDAQTMRCRLEKNETENDVEILYRGITDFYYIDEDLVKYESRMVITVPDEDLLLEKANDYRLRYRLQYQSFDEETNDYAVGIQDESIMVQREVSYYMMNLKELYETSSRFRSATNQDYTIDFRRVRENYETEGWNCN